MYQMNTPSSTKKYHVPIKKFTKAAGIPILILKLTLADSSCRADGRKGRGLVRSHGRRSGRR